MTATQADGPDTDSNTVKKLIQAVSDLRDTVEQQADRINELENKLADYQDHNERDKAEIHQKVTDVENQQAEASPATVPTKAEDEREGTESQTVKTPLERICACRSTSPIANSPLTRNACASSLAMCTITPRRPLLAS